MAVSSSTLPQSLLGFFYGELVGKILAETGSVLKTNAMLEEVGYNIGVRLVDFYLAEARPSFSNERERVGGIIKGTLKSFIGTNVEIVDWNAEGFQLSVLVPSNCLSANIDLPDALRSSSGPLCYMNVLAGIIRGAMDMTRVKCRCSFVKDSLIGDEVNLIRVEILEVIENEFRPDDD